METAAEEQGNLVPDLEAGHQDDIVDINQDDDFDFEIGGDDELSVAGETNDANGNLTYQADDTEAHDDNSYTYQPQEQAAQATVVESYDEESHDHGRDELDLEVSALETMAETVDFTEAAQEDGQGAQENPNQKDTEEHVEDGSHEEIYYEETASEVESFANGAQPEVGRDHDLMNTATSVDYVHAGGDLQDLAHEAEAGETGVEAETNALQETEYFEKKAEDVETAGEYEEEEEQDDDADDAKVAADAENGPIGGDSTDASLAKNDPSTEIVDESLDQSNWDTEDHADQSSKSRPNVTVSYRGQEYFLFAEESDEDPNTYFLGDVDSIHRPLSQFLGDVREVISSEVEASDEIFMKIDGLGLEFGESTAKEFLGQATLARIIEVNNKLVQHDGGSQSPELYIYLSVRSNPLHRFTELAKGADEGRGLSNFEKYYDEASGDASATNDEEQHGLSQDIISDDLSVDEAYDETEEMTGGTVDSHDVQQYHNPFRVDENQQQSLFDASMSEIVRIDEAEHDALAANAIEARASNGNANGSAEFTDGEHNGLGPDTTDAQEISFDNTLGDAISVLGQVEQEIAESWGDGHDVEGQDGQQPANVGDAEELEEQAEVLIDFSQEGHERTDDPTADAADDDDYLDLGDDGDSEQPADHAEATNDDAAGDFETSRQISQNSSATATLDGKENGHGEDAGVIPYPADPSQGQNQTEFDTSQPEVDEIDWNHDEDDDIGAATQNPTDLSPSSLSAKRSRQEDEGANGLGEENAVKRRRT